MSLGLPAQAASQTEAIVFSDHAGVPLAAGASLDIAIMIQDVTDLYGFDLEVHFRPNTLSVSDVQLGGFLAPGIPIGPTIDNGIIHFANTQTRPSEPKSGSGDLMVITVKALEDIDKVYLFITSATLSDRDSGLIPCRIINSGMVHLYLPLILH